MNHHKRPTEIRVSDSEDLLDIHEAAHRLGVTVRYMRRMTEEKRVRYLKVGRLIRFRPSDLQAFLKQVEVEAVTSSGSA